MPVYNGQKYIGEAISSILRQTHRDYELIVLDDGSTDATVPIVKSFMDERISLHRCRRQGLSSILNYGISISRSELIARMDADDIAKPYRLELQIAAMEKRRHHAVIGGAVEVFSEPSSARRRVRFPCSSLAVGQLLGRRCVVAHPTVLFRRAAVLEVGGYRRQFKRAQDYDLWLRLIDRGYLISNVKRVLIELRKHAENASVEHGRDQFLSADVALLCHRSRKAGVADPIDDVESIGPSIYESFRHLLLVDTEVQAFRLAHADLQKYCVPRLDCVLSELMEIRRKGASETVTACFLSIGIAYWRLTETSRCLRVFWIALSRDARTFVRLAGRAVAHRALLLFDRVLCG